MANPNKRKGTDHEVNIVNHLNARGIKARRVAQHGRLDVGDIHGIDPFVGQAKNYKDLLAALREGMDGAIVQATRVGADRLPVAFIKRPRKSVGQSYAVMPLDTFADILVRLAADAEDAWRYRDMADS